MTILHFHEYTIGHRTNPQHRSARDMCTIRRANPGLVACILAASVAATSGFAAGQHAQQAETKSAASAAKKAVNTLCPISGEPIDGRTTGEFDGHVVGFCCPGCDDAFGKWSAERRVNFIETSLQAAKKPETGTTPPAANPGEAEGAAKPEPGLSGEAKGPTYPYPLETCPVAGAKLGSMGDPIVRVYNNREVRFCCDSCIEAFEAEPEHYWAEIDKKIIEQQLLHYPIYTCIVADESLGSKGRPVNHVHNNRLVRFSSPDAIATFNADPEKYLKILDKKIVETLRPGYPLDTCVVAGAKLGSMGEPDEVIFMNRLVRFCCASCRPAFDADPHKFLKQLDEAYIRQQADTYPAQSCIVDDHPLDGRGGPYDVVAGDQLVRTCSPECATYVRHTPDAHVWVLRRLRQAQATPADAGARSSTGTGERGTPPAGGGG